MKINTLKILGIDFFNGTVKEVVQILKSGGLLVVPSGPGLNTIPDDHTYYRSLRSADLVIADSGYMAMIWNLFNRPKIGRISGLEFLVEFFADAEVKASKFVLADPTPVDANANRNYLNSVGFNLAPENSHLAPMYEKDNIVDPVLLAKIEAQRPNYVLLNIGGGTQEILGAYLRKNLSYKPAIICTGAAIAFLTGRQASIPTWADRIYLGWLFRCIAKPNLYIPRYFKAFRLFVLMVQYGSKAPVAV
jgi:N-acetylglucosaminyldiphosphoundecaprenol N-acetyl-beta-D-mannosaminyltransferase